MREAGVMDYQDDDTTICQAVDDPEEISGLIEPYEPNVPPLSHVSPSPDDHYGGRRVSLETEGAQEVFYRGKYVTHIELTGSSLLVGRRDVMSGHYPDIDLAMYRKQDPAISRRHLRIFCDINRRYFIEDLCNNNATFVNNYEAPLNLERRELRDGDRIFVSMTLALVFRLVP